MIIILCFLIFGVFSQTDGNPHHWDRKRRCDGNGYNPPCGLCEGIGGVPTSDNNTDITLTSCEIIATPDQVYPKPQPPVWPNKWMNTGFYEVQIFVKHDPLCFVQIPAMVSNGTHCYKPQQGTFYYSLEKKMAMMDYLQSRTVIPGVNMSYHFYHESQRVHPDIYKYGLPMIPNVCPCINVSTGIIAPDWLRDGTYLGREKLGIEFLWETMTVDHWVKGPHHAWVDVGTGKIVRLYQPFNGLEVFDPEKYFTDFPDSKLTLPLGCSVMTNLCIDPNANITNWLHNLCETLLRPIHQDHICNNI